MIVKPGIEPDQVAAEIGRYLVMHIGDLGLLIPQHQVYILEPTCEVQCIQGERNGWITLEGVRSPVYCLSENLQTVSAFPADRHICVMMNYPGGQFGLLCNQVSLFKSNDLDIMPVPECMCVSNIPLLGFAIHGKRVLYLTSSQSLLACLDENAHPIGDPESTSLRRSQGE